MENKVIAITGAGRGLGLSMAKLLASYGTKLALIDMDEDSLEQAKQQCMTAGANEVACFITNVAIESQVEQTFSQIKSQFQRIDGLVNNAGILRDGMLVKAKGDEVVSKLSVEDWQSVIDVNLTGVFLCAREAATAMIETKSKGVIINISSISRAGNFGQTNYTAAKAGVAAMSVTWAKELARHGIRSCAIAPGFIATEMTASMPVEAIRRAEMQIPLARMGESEEIAKTILFIFDNDYINGRVIEVDGGARL
ncbi:MAG: SDR family oxidoreductase [Kangiellaceae bacterium]|nr:SDR family oxidoreductase [Kangiellaceae bacterium]MCW9018503.1 SDR family oxidoreductase [Kangiellaceae bacterium]